MPLFLDFSWIRLRISFSQRIYFANKICPLMARQWMLTTIWWKVLLLNISSHTDWKCFITSVQELGFNHGKGKTIFIVDILICIIIILSLFVYTVSLYLIFAAWNRKTNLHQIEVETSNYNLNWIKDCNYAEINQYSIQPQSKHSFYPKQQQLLWRHGLDAKKSN